MSALGRYIVDAVVLERRSPTELARDHGISRRWIHKLVKRFKALTRHRPRSRPKSCGWARSWSPTVMMPGPKPSLIT